MREMFARRAPDSQWLFPSPQRGDRDDRARTFRESLLLTRAVPGWTCQDCGKLTFRKDTPKACPQCQGGLLEAKERALPENLQRFGFHDCRHHFISYAVMSAIDYMTIARWVGHKDGGVLIGKVFGHLSNEHAQAPRMSQATVNRIGQSQPDRAKSSTQTASHRELQTVQGPPLPGIADRRGGIVFESARQGLGALH